MRGKLSFLTGAAIGFVLGTRAGRERYEQLVDAARRVRDNPTFQEAAGVVQEQANRIYTESKDRVSGMSNKMSGAKPGRRQEERVETLSPPAESDPLADVGPRPPGTTF